MIDLRHGDCLDVMRTLADNSVDSVVTDPPYGIRFMGKAWDGDDIERRAAERRAAASSDPQATERGGHKSTAAEAGKYDLSPLAMLAFQAFSEDWAREAFRVLKPGGYLLTFASTRTYHRMACGVEAAGFEIRDQIGWTFGSGFPKSHNGPWGGTALKPAWEPICVARKPLIGTVEQNWKEHGTGAINIDGCRVGTDGGTAKGSKPVGAGNGIFGAGLHGACEIKQLNAGRWPANLIHDGSDEVISLFPRQAGAYAPVTGSEPSNKTSGIYGGGLARDVPQPFHGDNGSAARFFYCAKADRADRDDGLEGMPKVHRPNGNKWTDQDYRVTSGERPASRESGPRGNTHPTVKPTDLMRYLCRMVTPAGGVVLDPFMGSGSTGRGAVLEGFRFIGIEREAEYIDIARARIDSARRQGHQPDLLEQAA